MSYRLAGTRRIRRVAAQIRLVFISSMRHIAASRQRGGGVDVAATIWVNASVGVAAGGGEYHLAVIATAITLLALGPASGRAPDCKASRQTGSRCAR